MTQATLWELCCVGAAMFITSNLWFYLRLLRPIQQLADRAARLSQGDLDSFDAPSGGIAEVRQLRRALAGLVGHVRRAQEQGRAYSTQLASGQELERKRLARELHDDTVQSLIAITQAIDLAKNFATTDMARALSLLGDTRAEAVATVTRLRDLIAGLRPPALEELGFIPALEMQVNALADVVTSLTITGTARRLDEARELALFRAAQEALNNVERHSGANQLDVTVDYDSNGVILQIQDNGRGFQRPADLGHLVLKQHYGLVGIQERITPFHGELTVQSMPGAGTTLRIALPTSAQAQPHQRVQDPVCRAWIEPEQAYGSVTHDGETYFFCCPVCQGAFQKAPQSYTTPTKEL